MMRKAAFLPLLLILIASNTFSLTPAKILERIDQIRAPGDTFVFDLKITYKKEKEDIIQKFTVRVKDADKSLVKFTYPEANKGRLFLMVGNNMWIYIPGTRRPIRISPQQRLLGQISNGDVARVVFSLNYNAKLLGEEKIGESQCIKLELTPKSEQATYSRILLWAEIKSFNPIKAEFYTASGKLLKTAFYKGYAEVLGKERPLVLEIYDELRKGEYSIMEYSNMKVADTPKAFFQKTYLKHIR
ncbi:MAG: outer membrane lipoprotein-sorting protein [bacterium]|nr:outer membrane lipoprotein-sorting protein [bacterium]